MSAADAQDLENRAGEEDNRSPEEIKKEDELAERLSSLIEDANKRVVPLCKMIRKVRPFGSS